MIEASFVIKMLFLQIAQMDQVNFYLKKILFFENNDLVLLIKSIFLKASENKNFTNSFSKKKWGITQFFVINKVSLLLMNKKRCI